MLYKDDLKRDILYRFKKGFEQGLESEDIIKQLPQIPGSDIEQQQLFMDCKVYLFVDEVFKNHKDIAIKLAEKYIEKNEDKRDINLVDEKLYSMYIRNKQSDFANQLLEKLLIKEPNNKWSISKKVHILRTQGKYEEALKIIEQKYEIIKKDPAIFDTQFECLYALNNGDPEAIIKIFNRFSELDLGPVLEKRKEYIKKMRRYISRTYALEKTGKCKQKLRDIRGIIKKKIELEEKKNKSITNGENFDLSIVKSINGAIRVRRYDREKIEELLSKIENQTIKFIMKCQIEQVYGKKAEDIAKETKNFLKQNNGNINEVSRKSIKVLENLLTGKLRRLYLHDDWIRFQKQYFKEILEDRNEQRKEDKKDPKIL